MKHFHHRCSIVHRNHSVLRAVAGLATFTTVLLLLHLPTPAVDYHLASSGDDNNTGLSHDSAWKTLDRMNHLDLAPGDRIFLEAGTHFRGPLLLDASDRGTGTAPITITSSGNGHAMIDAAGGMGVFAHNTAGIVISNLRVFGDGHPRNASDGIAFHNDLSDNANLANITIDEVDVSGFGKNGIAIGGWNEQSGFQNIRITRARIHDNGLNGLIIYAQQPRANKQVYIANVEAYRNTGLPGVTPHSGSGIILGNVDGGIVEWSSAYDNGRLGNAGVGIWTYDSTKILFQYNESFNNHTSGDADGGGFDLDGGVTDSVMQHNYSHDNDGAGYGLFEYADAPPWYGNILRYNLSVNDGRRNGSAGIQIWNGGTSLLADATIHDNVVMVRTSQDGIPSAIAFKSPSHGFSIYQNAFLVSGEATMVSMATEQLHLTFSNNRCWSMTNGYFRDEPREKDVCATYFRFPG